MRLKRPSKLFLNTLGLYLISFSSLLLKTNSFVFIGEPIPPKSFLD